jgi:hypothetical protein
MFLKENNKRILSINKSRTIAYPYPFNKIADHPKFVNAKVFDSHFIGGVVKDIRDYEIA